MLKTHWRFFVVCFVLLGIMIIRFHQGQIQQDNYLGYTAALSQGLKEISLYDSRLFPGLPVIIFIFNLLINNIFVSGYLVVFAAFIGSYIILYKLTGSINSFLPLIFPPVMLNQSTQIATEIPVIFLILLSLYLFKKEQYSLAIIISAFGFWIRAIAIIPEVIIIAWLFLKDRRSFIKYLPYFLFPLAILAIFNAHFFGLKGLFQQFMAYRQLGVGTLGIIQIFSDIPRAWRWGWYRIFVSGIFYFSVAIVFLIESLIELKRKNAIFNKILAIIILASLVFIFSLNSVPFLENLGRYLSPIIPLFWLLIYKKFKDERWWYIFLPISIFVVLL
jgi:hypothetical protein